MKRSYLEHIKIVSFGAFSNKAVGPFAPHLNVVYGPNEAGKTTLASFVGGVLFGWEEARGSRNTYKPANAERSGSLFFAPCHLERIGEDSPSVILGGGGEAAAVEGSSVASTSCGRCATPPTLRLSCSPPVRERALRLLMLLPPCRRS